MAPIEVRKAMANIMYKSATDKSFRALCLKDGKHVLEEELGEKLEDKIEVIFVENNNKGIKDEYSSKKLIFVLPEFVGSLVKLSKEHLETVNGGMDNNRDAIDMLTDLLAQKYA